MAGKYLNLGPLRIIVRHDPLCSRMGRYRIKAGPLSLFSRTNNPNWYSLAAWHNPRSITWRWHLTLGWGRENTLKAPVWHLYRTNGLRQWTVNLAVFEIGFSQQRSMWRKDRPA